MTEEEKRVLAEEWEERRKKSFERFLQIPRVKEILEQRPENDVSE